MAERRVPRVSAAAVVCTLTAACGGNGGSRQEFSVVDQARAETINVRARDLPAGWASAPAGLAAGEGGGEAVDRTFDDCLRPDRNASAPTADADVHPFFHDPDRAQFPFGGSAYVVWDSGTPTPPTDAVPPNEPQYGSDPHGRPRAQVSHAGAEERVPPHQRHPRRRVRRRTMPRSVDEHVRHRDRQSAAPTTYECCWSGTSRSPTNTAHPKTCMRSTSMAY